MAQPEGRKRAKPGSTGEGEYYRIEVRPKKEFTTFRLHDVGDKGGIQRLAGKRASGSWDDHAWLISKDRAHISNGKLLGNDSDVKNVLDEIGPAEHVKGNIFNGHPRKNVPEKDKPTIAQKKARSANIKKAQKARKE